MSSAEFHNLCGKYVRERERALGIGQKSLLSAAYNAGVPIYTSSPGDSSIGMNVAALALEGNKCTIDPNLDVNETASIVLDGEAAEGGKSGVFICGGGSPKNFMLQTEPQIQEVLGIDEKGHDYLPADHRRASRHRRPLRRDAGRGRELGQDRSRPAARRRRLLPRFDGGAAAAHRVRAARATRRVRSSASTIAATP